MESMTSADLHTDFDFANFRELTIGELLADPLTRAVMKADRVDPDDLERGFRGCGPRAARARSAVTFKAAAGDPYGSRARGGGRASALARARWTDTGCHCPW